MIISSDELIKQGLPRGNARGINVSNNRFYEFPEENILVIKSRNDLIMTDLDKKHKIDSRTWRCNNEGYPVTSITSQGVEMGIKLSRVIANCTDENKYVKYINGNPKDNRESNLQIDDKKNVLACRGDSIKEIHNKNGTNSYQVRIRVDGKRINKNFPTYEEAFNQRKAWLKEYKGIDLDNQPVPDNTTYNRICDEIRSKKPAVSFNDEKLQQKYYFTDD